MNKRSKFLRAVEKLEYKGLYSRSFAEPFPDWFEGVALRFARVFVPELRFRDVVENPERFFGYVAGYAADLLDRAKNVKLSEIPRGKNWKLVRNEILAIRKKDQRTYAGGSALWQNYRAEWRANFMTPMHNPYERILRSSHCNVWKIPILRRSAFSFCACGRT